MACTIRFKVLLAFDFIPALARMSDLEVLRSTDKEWDQTVILMEGFLQALCDIFAFLSEIVDPAICRHKSNGMQAKRITGLASARRCSREAGAASALT